MIRNGYAPILVCFCLIRGAMGAVAAEPLSQLPGYDNYRQVRDVMESLSSAGRVSRLEWAEDGDSLTFHRQETLSRINLKDLSLEVMPPAKPSDSSVSGSGGGPRRERASRERAGRAQQSTWVRSPDGQWIARYQDHNVVLERVPETAEGEAADTQQQEQAASGEGATGNEEKLASPELVQVTTGGSPYFRYGTACWVYGEELFQDSAMWWSPDSRKLAFYEVDERHLPDYYLTIDNVEVFPKIHVERYPTAGMSNPYVGLLVYDLASKLTTRVDVGGDRLQYVYNVRFTPDGKEVLFSRTNRRQDTLEVMAADAATGKSRLVVSEQQPTWQNNKPLLQFLGDGQRFIWETERTGWKQYELRHLNGSLSNPLTPVTSYPVASIVRVDEAAGWLYYTAYSGENPLDAHLHRVQLDGAQPVRLTSGSRHHSAFHIAPNHKWFVATYEAVDAPPTTALFNDKGEEVAILATGDESKAKELGLVPPELFVFQADDGVTDLQGILHKPAHFDPNRKYPLVINVYGGPSSRGISNHYQPADPHCEFGFLIATIANRGTTDRGKAFETATYLKLGQVDLKDQADGVKILSQRPYVDATRVGIMGHSYGGYMSALAVVRYPDLFHVAVAGAPVTDWRNYDTIYTERYMRTPQENPEGYRDSSCLTYANNLRGKLLLMHGLVDDNVHPSNTWQLVDALQRENRRFDLMVFPRSKHGLGTGSESMRWEYLHQHLRAEPLLPPAS
ncbi:MAG: S9 family peptidase [Pirellulaceae bacterium]